MVKRERFLLNVVCRSPSVGQDESMSVEILDLDGNQMRCAVIVDGLVRFVGSAEECCRRLEIRNRRDDRAHLDAMLVRATQRPLD